MRTELQGLPALDWGLRLQEAWLCGDITGSAAVVSLQVMVAAAWAKGALSLPACP